jgi:hypothetical protein
VPGAVFGVIAIAVLALVATALNPAQPPPPAVAEYAPAAVKAITDAPPEQVAENGTGKSTKGGTGGDQGGLTSPSPPAVPSSLSPPPVIDVARVSRCIGSPPRQTEDPQSPPCIPYFDGDNGGATAPGVTRNEIRIAMANASTSDIDLLTRYFNTRFQFYGRHIKIVRDVGCFGGNPSSAKSAADDTATLNVFGAVGFCDIGGVEYYYYDELARKKIVSVSNRVTVQYERDLAKFHPYEWTYLPTFDKGSSHLMDLACTLKGKNATHAGAEYTLSPRKFGLISNKFNDAPSPDLAAANAVLKACGIDPVRAQITYERNGGATGQGATPQTAQEVASAVVKMHDAGVTTLLMLVHSLTARQIVNALDSQGYEPEIGVSTEFYNDEDVFTTTYPKSQSTHMFGISTWNKVLHPQDEPWYAAIKEMDPQHTFTEDNNAPPFSYEGAKYDYEPLLMMAAGIQMAGPHLTAESFAKGLQSAAWPNPPTEHWPGKVTVSPGTHSYMEDATAIWWDETNRSEYSIGGNGMFCYVENGRRRRLGQWPANDGLFVRPCRRF